MKKIALRLSLYFSFNSSQIFDSPYKKLLTTILLFELIIVENQYQVLTKQKELFCHYALNKSNMCY